MVQKYTIIDSESIKKVGAIPSTRIESWKLFRDSGQKSTIKSFILVVLEDSPTALSCRQISEISGVEIQSLCRPLQELVSEKKINTTQRTKGSRKRTVIAYSINKIEGNV